MAFPDIVNMKICVTGDGAVGKTSLLYTYLEKRFPENYQPTVIDNFQSRIPIRQGGTVVADIWDTAGQEDLESIRVLSYPDTHVGIICYSTVSVSSFENVGKVWLKELHSVVPETPFILVGTKKDLCSTHPERVVTEEEAQRLCKKLKGYESVQCSALEYKNETKSNVKMVFSLAVSCHLNRLQDELHPSKPWYKKCCTLL